MPVSRNWSAIFRPVPDARLTLARTLNSQSAGDLASAKEKRDQRDKLIRRVRAEDRDYWTYERLAAEVGVSKELIAYIVKGGSNVRA
jgi:hypothetical protein